MEAQRHSDRTIAEHNCGLVRLISGRTRRADQASSPLARIAGYGHRTRVSRKDKKDAPLLRRLTWQGERSPVAGH